MPLRFASLNSGSNANCYYIGNETHSILVDAGLSCRETRKRLARLGIDIGNISALFITHEHSDHVRGAAMISKTYRIPVYLSTKTYTHFPQDFNPELIRHYNEKQSVKIGNLIIKAFSKQHDAADPHSFTITHNGQTVGVMTDIGCVCDKVKAHFNTCQAVFLEANYDVDMLLKGRYPYYLKTRIHGDYGHLSNHQALELFISHRHPDLKYIILSHLSKENNRPEIVSKLFEAHALQTTVVVASRNEESPLFCLSE